MRAERALKIYGSPIGKEEEEEDVRSVINCSMEELGRDSDKRFAPDCRAYR